MILGLAARLLQLCARRISPSHVVSWNHEIGHGLTAAPRPSRPAVQTRPDRVHRFHLSHCNDQIYTITGTFVNQAIPVVKDCRFTYRVVLQSTVRCSLSSNAGLCANIVGRKCVYVA